MRALSIHQPWASYLAHAVKRYETRSWHTTYRGLVAIHAGKFDGFVTPGMVEHHPDAGAIRFPLGVVVAVGNLREVLHTADHAANVTLEEQRLGDWSAGRFAWGFENMTLLRVPVPLRGFQGLWRLTPEQVAQIADQLPSPL